MPKRIKLHIEDVYKSYDGRMILDNIDLSVAEGELCTVVGPSGCGKSTLLRLVLGQEMPDRGRIEIDGQALQHPNKDRGIVYQKYSLFPNRTVLENVVIGKTFTEGSWWNPWHKNQEHIDEAMEYLSRVRLSDSAHKYPHELSGGMQQRAAIAQALIMKPPILLMDEPFGALDPDTREDLQIFLLELKESEKLTVFFVTHDLVEACFLGTRLLALSQYYTDDRGSGEHVNRGGRIVADYFLEPTSSSSEVKESRHFIELIHSIREEGFNPDVLQHVSEFNLKHANSYQTLLEEEHKGSI
jgi:NitT/TauT family transport system ATP-binding protein